VKIMNGPIDRKRLIEVMEKENFIFIGWMVDLFIYWKYI
jgi:hypothetical protein